jgi:hypothetical protein
VPPRATGRIACRATNQLAPAAADDGIEEVIEERRQKALAQIERLDEESKRTGDGKTKKPN